MARLETGAARDARLRAWEVFETLPMPQRTDEEWRRTDLRGLRFARLGVAPCLHRERNGQHDGKNQCTLHLPLSP